MKLFYAYKKQFKLLFLGILLLLIPVFFSYGQNISDLQNKIGQRNSDIERLEQEIKIFQAELDSLGKQKNSLAGSIKQLDITRKKLNADISITQKKIENANYKISNLSSDIGNKEDSISNNLNAIAIDIKKINEIESSSFVETLFSDNDFTSIWNDVDNMMLVREGIEKKIKSLREVKEDLEGTRKVTIVAKNELVSLKSKLTDQRKIIDQNTAEKNKLLAQTKNSETSYQKLLAEQVARKDALEKELQDYESQLKFILDPSKLPGRVLSWPLDYVYVTSPFGPRPKIGSGFHSGTDFRASVGTPVKAMADGVVGGAGDTDATCYKASFGKWIFIEYGNGLSSTYGHLSYIKAFKGQKVKRGDIVGYSGNTGSSTGPHLHTTVYVSSAVEVKTIPSKSCPGKTLTQPIAPTNAYLDPMKYLPLK